MYIFAHTHQKIYIKFKSTTNNNIHEHSKETHHLSKLKKIYFNIKPPKNKCLALDRFFIVGWYVLN